MQTKLDSEFGKFARIFEFCFSQLAVSDSNMLRLSELLLLNCAAILTKCITFGNYGTIFGSASDCRGRCAVCD